MDCPWPLFECGWVDRFGSDGDIFSEKCRSRSMSSQVSIPKWSPLPSLWKKYHPSAKHHVAHLQYCKYVGLFYFPGDAMLTSVQSIKRFMCTIYIMLIMLVQVDHKTDCFWVAHERNKFQLYPVFEGLFLLSLLVTIVSGYSVTVASSKGSVASGLVRRRFWALFFGIQTYTDYCWFVFVFIEEIHIEMFSDSHRIHVWYIYLHLPYKSTKCSWIYHTIHWVLYY